MFDLVDEFVVGKVVVALNVWTGDMLGGRVCSLVFDVLPDGVNPCITVVCSCAVSIFVCTLVGNVEDVDENIGSFVMVCVDDLMVDGVASTEAPVTIPVLLCFGLRVDDNVGNVDIRLVCVFVGVSVIVDKVSDDNLEATLVVELKGVSVMFFDITSDVLRAKLEVESVTVFSNDLVVVTVDVRNVRCLEVFAD